METNNELQNVIPEGSNREYTLIPEGTHLMGLVKIKNKEMKDFKTGEPKAGYQFSFRSMEIDDGWLNKSVTASVNEKSGMFKLLKILSPAGKVKQGIGSSEAFGVMTSLIGKWYYVTVSHVVREGKTYANFENAMLAIGENQSLGDAVRYFEKKWQEKQATQGQQATPAQPTTLTPPKPTGAEALNLQLNGGTYKQPNVYTSEQ